MGNLPSNLLTPLLSLDSWPEWMSTDQLLSDIKAQLGEDAVNWLAEELGSGQILLQEVNVPDLIEEIQEKLAQSSKYGEEASEAQAGEAQVREAQASEAHDHPGNSEKQENSDTIQAAVSHPVGSASRTIPSYLPSNLFTFLLSLESWPEWMSTEQLLSDIKVQLGEDATNWLTEQLGGQILPEEVNVPDLLKEIQEKLAQSCKYAEEARDAQAGEAHDHPGNSEKQENSEMIQAAVSHPVESASRPVPSSQLGEDIKDDTFKVVYHILDLIATAVIL